MRLVGNVTAGMEYVVLLDDRFSTGNPEEQVLASFGGLALGYHNVSIIANPTGGSGSGGMLFFESAVITVGTGRSGSVFFLFLSHTYMC